MKMKDNNALKTTSSLAQNCLIMPTFDLTHHKLCVFKRHAFITNQTEYKQV